MTAERVQRELAEALREQIARAYAAWVSSPYDPSHWQTDNGFDMADALLAGPLAPLLAAQEAVKRVEALIAEAADQQWNATFHVSTLRRALDGTT